MTPASILTPEQLDEFDRQGVVRVPGLLSPERVRGARAHVRHRLAKLGLWQDGSWHQDRARLLGQTGLVDGVTLEVMELTGAPGDAHFIDLRVLHASAPNATDYPRVMVTHRFMRVDVMGELTEAFEWKRSASD